MYFLDSVKAIVWGFIQGMTEFLPISSSGHLVLLSAFFGEIDLFFILVLHLGTLCAIFTYYQKDIVHIIKGFWQNPLCPVGEGKWVYMVVLATLPSVIGAFLLSPLVKQSLTDPYWAGFGFILTGFCLFWAQKFRLNQFQSNKVFCFKSKPWGVVKASLIVGLSQTLAFFPGISRSGWTIATALFMGFSHKEAMLFSFLLAIPAIIGGTLFELIAHTPDFKNLSVLTLFLGFLSSWVFGYLALKVLIRSLEKVFFSFFAFYLWPLGLWVLFFFS